MHRRVERRQHLCSRRRRATGVRKAVSLVANMGELPVLVFTDQFVLPGLVKQEGVDGIPVLLSLSDLLEQARELQVSLRRYLEPVP